MTQSYLGRTNAVEFPTDVEWVNVDRPVTLRELRGKLVLLDFWTYCCINCMHVLPELKKLERAFLNEIVVIGVHSPKFTTEKDTANVRKAVQRYEVEHPVVNDRAHYLWNSYASQSWPTLMFIDPQGKVIGKHEGEASAEGLIELAANMVKEFDAKGLMDRSPVTYEVQRRTDPSPLSFPGKVLADAASRRVFISDSNHNRIVVAGLDGQVQDVIGSGREGFVDGDVAFAEFNHPQGLAVDGDVLYVADTENHSIRKVDLRAKTVDTIAGTGGHGFSREAGPATETALRSPWDLLHVNGNLLIAMAGSHQIWLLDLDKGYVGAVIGSGAEALVDGAPDRAALAQPSALATDGRTLYWADSETSSIRSMVLDGQSDVRTIVGQGLFVYGNVDGKGHDVRLQHPLGVAMHRGALLVADTYNHAIKLLDPTDGTSTTLYGDGVPGLRDGAQKEARFFEPGGISVLDQAAYIADTNNHVIRTADMSSGEVRTLELIGLEKA